MQRDGIDPVGHLPPSVSGSREPDRVLYQHFDLQTRRGLLPPLHVSTQTTVKLTGRHGFWGTVLERGRSVVFGFRHGVDDFGYLDQRPSGLAVADLPRLRPFSPSDLLLHDPRLILTPFVREQALLEATRFRANVSRSDACNTCFNRYCYNGTTSSGSVTPSGGGTGTGTGSTPSASAKNSGAGKAVVGWMGAGAVVAAMAVLV